jgi:hypothetical protein
MRASCILLVSALAFTVTANAAEHVTLKNGFDMICDHRETVGENTRLYVGTGNDNFVEVKTANIASIDTALPSQAPAPKSVAKATPAAPPQKLTPSELRELLTAAGAERNLDVDLLACVVHAESNGQVRAVSRTGAKGLMQLMPGTAAQLGVTDSFRPDQNIHGGTLYLNALLLRYHDNLALALAAYNAGPKAVDRYHGVPPYRETRAYVARIIHEFNQRKLAEEKATRLTSVATSRTGERD